MLNPSGLCKVRSLDAVSRSFDPRRSWCSGDGVGSGTMDSH